MQQFSITQLTKPYPAPIPYSPTATAPSAHLLNWSPGAARSTTPATCNGCQQSLFWSWNFHKKKPHMVDKTGWPHDCKTPHKQDVFPGWCDTCGSTDLLLLRGAYGFELTESYGLPHTCEQDPLQTIQEMSAGKCRGCKAPGLFWIQTSAKFTLVDATGTQHHCQEFGQYAADFAEAKRLDYAFEKAWLKSIPDDTKCKKCKGEGYTTFLSKAKHILKKYGSTEPIKMHRPCMRCKRLGTFSVDKKKFYLKELRKKYWPFKGGTHKWKQYDGK